mmetsp:Transcript_108342/g.314942  ORF Transcript_108342/g.314942 Transcript_108342/m.314942 type:complete len:248 (-) Transcript_108342:62-805(-)
MTDMRGWEKGLRTGSDTRHARVNSILAHSPGRSKHSLLVEAVALYGEAKVCKLELAVTDILRLTQEVLRLQIAVSDVALVEVCDRVQQNAARLPRLLLGVTAVVLPLLHDSFKQLTTLHQLQHHPIHPVRLVLEETTQAHHIWVRDLRENLGLSFELLERLHLGPVLLNLVHIDAFNRPLPLVLSPPLFDPAQNFRESSLAEQHVLPAAVVKLVLFEKRRVVRAHADRQVHVILRPRIRGRTAAHGH